MNNEPHSCNQGSVIWITGLSGAGKTSVASQLVTLLRSTGSNVVFLDGDQLRNVFGLVEPSEVNHGRESRLSIAIQYSRLCQLISNQGLIVVIATISLFREVHQWNRNNLDRYFEVYLKVPIAELRLRDPKKIYERFDAGQMKNVAGLDFDVDEPTNADMTIDFNESLTAEQIALDVCAKVRYYI